MFYNLLPKNYSTEQNNKNLRNVINPNANALYWQSVPRCYFLLSCLLSTIEHWPFKFHYIVRCCAFLTQPLPAIFPLYWRPSLPQCPQITRQTKPINYILLLWSSGKKISFILGTKSKSINQVVKFRKDDTDLDYSAMQWRVYR